jgi:hypothetical protein
VIEFQSHGYSIKARFISRVGLLSDQLCLGHLIPTAAIEDCLQWSTCVYHNPNTPKLYGYILHTCAYSKMKTENHGLQPNASMYTFFTIEGEQDTGISVYLPFYCLQNRQEFITCKLFAPILIMPRILCFRSRASRPLLRVETMFPSSR